MRSISQAILSIKIEYHFKRAKAIEKRLRKPTKSDKCRLFAAINLHRYKAEKYLVEYEISEGLRNSRGKWTGLTLNNPAI